MAARLKADARFRRVHTRTQLVLSHAVVHHADGNGRWFTKNRTISEELGCSRSTVVRAWTEAVDAGLITREAWARPDGFQGSSSYFLDPALVWPDTYASDGQGGADLTHLVEPEHEEATSWRSPAPPTSWRNSAPPEQDLNWLRPSCSEEGVNEGSIQVVHEEDPLENAEAELREALEQARDETSRWRLESNLRDIERHQGRP
jgi:hypothetical protein